MQSPTLYDAVLLTGISKIRLYEVVNLGKGKFDFSEAVAMIRAGAELHYLVHFISKVGDVVDILSTYCKMPTLKGKHVVEFQKIEMLLRHDLDDPNMKLERFEIYQFWVRLKHFWFNSADKRVGEEDVKNIIHEFGWDTKSKIDADKLVDSIVGQIEEESVKSPQLDTSEIVWTRALTFEDTGLGFLAGTV